MITAVISRLKEKNRSSRRVEGTVNIPFDLNSAGSRRRHGRPPKPRPEPVQNDVPVFVNGVQNSMATIPFLIDQILNQVHYKNHKLKTWSYRKLQHGHIENSKVLS
ncbi:Uncharacterized protein Fot_00280 [Forsythia ovata]|uniref:Uncharacterized protein n=1 Tax=Forsythia ovata TaxID=205694 RepID=A0ABD1X0N9_9LAMI